MRTQMLWYTLAAATSLTLFSGCDFPSLYDEETVARLYSQNGHSTASNRAVSAPAPASTTSPGSGAALPATYNNGGGAPVDGTRPVPVDDRDRGRDRDHDKDHKKDRPVKPFLPSEPGDHRKEPVQVGWPPSHDEPDQHPHPDHPQPQHPGSGYPAIPTDPPGGANHPPAPWADDSSGSGESRRAGAIGEPCTGSGDSICLGLKYVVYQEPYGDPIETDRDAADNIREVNQLWRSCGIQFQIDRYQPVEPWKARLRYRTANHWELNDIRRRFMDDETLLVVMTGTWDRRGTLGNSWANAWTNLPGEGIYGSILERPVSQNPNILAHELGHYLSLDHVSSGRMLMSPVIGRNSTEITPYECESARWAAQYFWKKMIHNPSRQSEGAQP